MKKFTSILLIIVLAVSLAACGAKKPAETAEPAADAAEEAAEPEGSAADENSEYDEEGDIFLGVWACGRATITIARCNEGYKCYVTWGDSASRTATWEYDCVYDGMGLSSVETGVHKMLTFNQEGAIVEEEVIFTDGATSMTIGEDGKLTWNEFKEDQGKDMAFDHSVTSVPAPDPSEFIEHYFLIIGSVEEGTAGVSLKQAVAACSAMQFAAVNRLCIADYQPLRDNLLEAWEELTEEEQASFDSNFVDIVKLLDACIEDWDANKAVFEDAGVADLMYVLLSDPISVLSWESLRNSTLTMGNGD